MLTFVYFILINSILNISITSGSEESRIPIEDKTHWFNEAMADLDTALKLKLNTNKAKNVIIFIGDGMGLSTVTASRILGKTEKGFLSFEKLPHMGALKTYSANKFVPDSCSTATAMFCGVKANQRTGGVDATVVQGDCLASLVPDAQLESILTWAQRAHKATGFVTTTRVTHATPAALYARTASRYWECEATKPANASLCKDIARQLIEDLPGRNINVIMGGGRQALQSNVTNKTHDIIDSWGCYSRDGRDLIKTWMDDKATRNAKHQFLEKNSDLANMNDDAEFTMGIFANGHLNMEHERNKGPNGMPSLTDMTQAAIKLLQNKDNGYILMVEGGLIDYAHHRGKAKKALNEALSFSEAIDRALKMVDLEETLIIVTSDHSHPLVISGYADRTAKITGIAQLSKVDGVPYTTLLYGIGGENNYKYAVANESVVRENPATVDTDDFEYSQQAGVKTAEVPHDGTDVLVYAQGPMAHLLHAVHEQTYVAYVIAYAAQIGPYADGGPGPASAANKPPLINLYLLTVIAIGSALLWLFGSRH